MLYYDKAKIFNEEGVTKIVMPSKKTGMYYALSPISVVIIVVQIFKLFRNLNEYSQGSFGYIVYSILIFFISLFNTYLFVFFLWTCFGKEIIEYNEKKLKIKKTIFGLGYTKEISINNINSITFNEKPDYGVLLIIKNGKIRITTSDKIYNIGLGINDSNANEVIKALNKQVLNIIK